MQTFWKVNTLGERQISGSSLKKPFATTIILNLILGLAVFLIQPFLPPQIPLYYGMAEAEKVVAPSWALIIPIFISLGILGLNFSIGLLINDEFLKKTLALTGIAASFFAAITILKIVLLVGSF